MTRVRKLNIYTFKKNTVCRGQSTLNLHTCDIYSNEGEKNPIKNV